MGVRHGHPANSPAQRMKFLTFCALSLHCPNLAHIANSGWLVLRPGGGGGRLRGSWDANYYPPPQGASGQRLVVKGTNPRSRWALKAPWHQRRPIVHKHQKHYPEHLTWGEHPTRHRDLAV